MSVINSKTEKKSTNGNYKNKESFKNNKLAIASYPGYTDLLHIHTSNKERYPFLLQSTSSENINSRFDILFAFPEQQLTLNSDFNLFLDKQPFPHNDFLKAIDELWCINKTQKTDEEIKVDMPFTGGWFLYLSYELLGQIEETVEVHSLPPEMNTAIAVRIPAAIIYDRKKNTTYLISENNSSGNHLPELKKDYKSTHYIENFDIKFNLNCEVIEEQVDNFTSRILKAKKYIFDGDIFQSNLSREWKVADSEHVESISVYKKLRQKNPAAFSGLVNIDNLTIISSSPERLVRVLDKTVETRPIAGTIKRSTDKAEDTGLVNKLLNSSKDKAEHIMLIDMERNDLGRVCKTGTVKVNEMMVVESLAHVHHIVSNITGELKENTSPGTVIKAVFPGGSITGCPKVRCMEIIHELENKARNSYTGSMGYLNNNGDMDLNILIRTLEKTKAGISFRTGAGIVHDSIVENELQETNNKAKGLIATVS